MDPEAAVDVAAAQPPIVSHTKRSDSFRPTNVRGPATSVNATILIIVLFTTFKLKKEVIYAMMATSVFFFPIYAFQDVGDGQCGSGSGGQAYSIATARSTATLGRMDPLDVDRQLYAVKLYLMMSDQSM